MSDAPASDLADARGLAHLVVERCFPDMPACAISFQPILQSGITAMKRRDVLAGIMALTGCAVAPSVGFAQARYPDRAIKLVVPFAPGGVNDAVARLWAERMKAMLGNVYIENQGGAGGAVGALAVAHAQPDGYTLLLGGAGALVLNPIGTIKPLYDPLKDFEAIAMLAVPALSILVNPERSRAHAQGADRLCQGQSGQARLWFGRRGLDDAPRRRAVQVAGGNA